MLVCVQCGSDSMTVRFSPRARSCNKCSAKARAARDAAAVANGQCPCGNPIKEGRKKCPVCLARAAGYTKSTQRRNMEQGRCPCGKDKDGKRKYCRQCLDVSSARTLPRNKAAKCRAVSTLGGHCNDCGFSAPDFPEVFDFHHLDPSVKTDKISSMITSGKSWETIVAELLKCILLCSNCHRIRHAKENK